MLYYIVTGYLIIINLAAFILMGADKQKARKKARRIPEKTFFLIALIGGNLGAWGGMYTFRHKTQHWYFVLGMPAIVIAQAVLVYFLATQL